MDDRISAANEAVNALGGPTKAAKALSEYYGRPISRMTPQNWRRDGVGHKYVAGVSHLTGVPCHRLDPEHHPKQETAA